MHETIMMNGYSKHNPITCNISTEKIRTLQRMLQDKDALIAKTMKSQFQLQALLAESTSVKLRNNVSVQFDYTIPSAGKINCFIFSHIYHYRQFRLYM